MISRQFWPWHRFWLSALLFVFSIQPSLAQSQEDEETPAFLNSYVALTRQLDELLRTSTTYRFKVDGERVVDAFNERLDAEMDKSFVLMVKDLDMEGSERVRIEFSGIEGISEEERNQVGLESSSIVVEMDDEEAYRVERGSRVRVMGKPKLLFRPGPNVRRGRMFQDSVIAGWQVGEHACYLLFPGGRATLLID